jgi:hypothetical protein
MFWKWLASGTGLRFFTRCNAFCYGFGLCSLLLFQFKLQLLELDDNLFAPGSEDHVPQLLDHELQVLDVLAA